MKPIIGVTPSIEKDATSYSVSIHNIEAIEEAGGIPLILPYMEKDDSLEKVVNQLNGLYLTGGNDIDPVYFQEEPHPNLGYFHPGRDAFEMKIIQAMLHKDKPILGVCKGSQMLNLATGGSMYQDIPSQIKSDLIQHAQEADKHVPTHHVELTKGSLLYKLVGKEVIRVNSFHHQSNRTPGDGFIFSGAAEDGVVEAVESTHHRFALGLQWHPESLLKANDKPSRKIFRGFIDACKN